MAKRTRVCDVLTAPAETPIADMNRLERVIWLQRHGVPDEQILDALFDPADPELERFTNELAAAFDMRGHSDG